MKTVLRRLFSPILKPFEQGDEEFAYKPLNRKILIVLGIMFTLLSLGIAYVVSSSSEWGALLPVIIFLGVGLVCIVVGTLGTDRAVAKIWGNRS